MTKLALIEELALEHGDTCYQGQEYHFTKSELEQLRQAIIRDFVSTREPVAIVNKNTPSWYLQELTGVFGLKHGTQLFNLSDWSE